MKKIFLILVSILFSTLCSAQPAPGSLPATINFERQVIQQNNGEDGIGTTTYYFTINGDYAMIKKDQSGQDEKAAILYTKEGHMCIIDETKKTITLMSTPRLTGEGARAGKEIAEKINKKPLPKDDKEVITVKKTGKTKMICGYTAYEYEVRNDGGSSGWWYAEVDFDPVKIYTMGLGNSATSVSVGNENDLKNNPTAIPVMNKNYLMAEIDAGGQKGLETKSITKTTFTFSTLGYTIKDMSKMGLKEMIRHSGDN